MTQLPGVRDELVELGGIRFHYRDWPNAGAPALVLLHGFTGHARSWDGFAAALQPHYRVLALDQRGHGESGWTTDYSRDAMVADVDAFVRALGLRKFALLGLSMGGFNAYHYAASKPAEVERLVIVDIGPALADAGSHRIMTGVAAGDVFDTPEQALVQMRAGNPRAPEDALRHRGLNNLMLMEDGRWTWRYDRALRQPGRLRDDPSVGWALLPKIACPTLLVRGEESDVLAPETAARMVREIRGCEFVEVAGSGHSIPLDRPEGFLEAVRPFLLRR
ncbi:MAG: alpha/beta hydrolase [Chloroflexi bacterium]|nr:alpha/beta hydrolase [Chloroflexota bacterium]